MLIIIELVDVCPRRKFVPLSAFPVRCSSHVRLKSNFKFHLKHIYVLSRTQYFCRAVILHFILILNYVL